MRGSRSWPRQSRALHNHHVASTIWNDFRFRDDDIIMSMSNTGVWKPYQAAALSESSVSTPSSNFTPSVILANLRRHPAWTPPG
jgi:hypothetical protein